MDLQDFGRCTQMFAVLQPYGRQINDVCEGFGSNCSPVDGADRWATFSRPFRVLTPLLCPFFSAQKFLPLALMGGIVIELELDSYDACIVEHDIQLPAWEIVQPMILVDSVQVDPALSSSYAKHLLEGKTLPISYHNFFSMQATLTDTNAFSLPIQRGFSRLSAIFVSLHKSGHFFVTDPHDTKSNRESDTFRFQVQLGGDLKPTYQTDCVGELFYRLRMCQGIHAGTDTVGIEFAEYYGGGKFIIGISLERVLGNEVAHTGVSTMGGQLLYIQFKHMQNIQPSLATVHVVCHYDCVLSITSGGAEVAY